VTYSDACDADPISSPGRSTGLFLVQLVELVLTSVVASVLVTGIAAGVITYNNTLAPSWEMIGSILPWSIPLATGLMVLAAMLATTVNRR
jgi:hypothetical protein